MINVLSKRRLRELLSYDPDTGKVTWRKTGPGRRANLQAGCKRSDGYIDIEIEGVTCKAHRLAWLLHYGEWSAGELDHKNRDKADNRISNLRLATKSQNCGNAGRQKNNVSGFKGVYFKKARSHLPRPWVAQIMKEGKSNHLGCFASAEEAHAAYIVAANRLFGKFARA